MGVIRPYEQQVAPQGFDTARASAADFDTGRGMVALGQGIQSAGESIYQVDEQRETSAAHAAVSDLRMQLTKEMLDSETSAQPGDMGYADRFRASAQQKINTAGNQFQTLRGRDTFQRSAAELEASFYDRSLMFQRGLAGQQAVVDYQATEQNNSRTLMMDPSQYDSIKAENSRAIMNGEGNYGHLDMARRAELVTKLNASNAWAANYALVERDPQDWLQRSGVESAANRLNGVPIGGVPGSYAPPAKLSSAVQQYLPTIQTAAVASGVDANILAAQMQTESGGNSSATSPKGARGVSQFMPATAARYNVDVGNPESSINGQAAYMADLLKMFGGDYSKALAGYNWGEGNVQKAMDKYGAEWLAHAPSETQKYVSGILGSVKQTMPAAMVAQQDPQVFVEAKRLNPTLADLPAAQFIQLVNHAETRQNQIMAVAKAQLEQTWKNQSSQAMTTGDVGSPLPQDAFVKAYGAAEGIRRYNEEYRPMLDLGANVKQAYAATNAQQEATLEALRPIPNSPGFAAQQARFETYASAVNNVRQQRQADPVQFAINARLPGVQALDMSTPQSIADGLAARVAPAKALSESFGTRPAFLTKPEAEGMNAALKAMPTSQKLGYLDAMRTQVRDPDAFRTIIQQITPDSPVTLAAASLLAKQDPMTVATHWFSPNQTVSPKDVAGIVLEGEALLNKSKGDKQQDGSSRGFPMPQELLMRQAFENKVGNAFAGMPGAADTAYQAVRAYYAGKSARTGNLSSKESPDTDLIDESVKAVIGNTHEQNGTTVLMPWGMTDDKFQPALQRAFDISMQRNGMTDSRLNQLGLYGLQGAGDGKYLLKSGTDFLRGASGQPMVLDIFNAGQEVSGRITPLGSQPPAVSGVTPAPRGKQLVSVPHARPH